MTPQKWYVAVLVVSSDVVGEPTAEPAIDLQYRLVQASDHEHAFQRAVELGRHENHSYVNSSSQTVRWRFLGLHDLREIDSTELADGTEVYSRIVRAEPTSTVVTKDRLTCFWEEANRDRTASRILDDESGS